MVGESVVADLQTRELLVGVGMILLGVCVTWVLVLLSFMLRGMRLSFQTCLCAAIGAASWSATACLAYSTSTQAAALESAGDPTAAEARTLATCAVLFAARSSGSAKCSVKDAGSVASLMRLTGRCGRR